MLWSFAFISKVVCVGGMLKDLKSPSNCCLESGYEEGKTRDKNTGLQSTVKHGAREGNGSD